MVLPSLCSYLQTKSIVLPHTQNSLFILQPVCTTLMQYPDYIPILTIRKQQRVVESYETQIELTDSLKASSIILHNNIPLKIIRIKITSNQNHNLGSHRYIILVAINLSNVYKSKPYIRYKIHLKTIPNHTKI